MTVLAPERTISADAQLLTAVIFDVDGVLLASPHEQAWREALAGLADPARFTTAMYQAEVAGKPRLAGAHAALAALGRTEADFDEYREQRAWTAWKYAMWDSGCKLPTQLASGRSRCFCGAVIDIKGTSQHVHVAHMEAV